MELKNYPAPYVLFGSLLAMGNRLQAAGDRSYDEITTKQWFVLAVLETFSAPPTLGELARGVGSSHQNVKQLVLKLQQKGYVALAQDGRDARKNRVHRTPKCAELPEKYRVLITLFYRDGYAIREISAMLKIPESTIGTRLSRAREMLRKRILSDREAADTALSHRGEADTKCGEEE